MATGRPVDNPVANSGLDGQYSKFARDAFWKKLSMDPWVGNMFRHSRNNYETHMHTDESVYSPSKPFKLLKMRRQRGTQPHKLLQEISVQQVSRVPSYVDDVAAVRYLLFARRQCRCTWLRVSELPWRPGSAEALVRSYVKGTSEYDARVAAGSKPELALNMSAKSASRYVEDTSGLLRTTLYPEPPIVDPKVTISGARIGAARQHFLFRWADAWSDIHYSGPSKWDKEKYPDGRIKVFFKKLNVFRYILPTYWYDRWHGYWHAGDDIRQIRYNYKLKRVPAHSQKVWKRLKYYYYDQPASSAMVDPTLDHVPIKWRPYVAKLRGKGMRLYDEWFIRRPTSHLLMQGASIAAILYAVNYGWQCFKTENTLVDLLAPSVQAWRKRPEFTTEFALTSEIKGELRKLWRTVKDVFED